MHLAHNFREGTTVSKFGK